MSKQKNVILIFSDQFRFDTIAAHKNDLIKTPALDSLIEMGTDFTNAYTPSPVCIAARFSLHSGLAPYENPCNDNLPMPKGKKSFMEILSENGYITHGVGKMHFHFQGQSSSTLWGFDARDTGEEGGEMDDFRKYLDDNGYDYVKDPQGVRSDMYYIPQPSQLPARLHNNTWVTEKSIEFLEKRDAQKPFFLMTSFIKPHPPFESPVPWNKLYRCHQMGDPYKPEGFEELLVYINEFQNRYKYRSQGTDRNLARQIRAAYYSAISFLDYNIGLLLNYLKENDLYKDTVIIFTADHGEMLGDYGSYGKRCFLNPSSHIPLIMFDPERQGGKSCNTPVTLTDIMPTVLEEAGIKLKEYSDFDYVGESLNAIADGKTGRQAVYGQFSSASTGLYMIKTEQYKYIYSAADRKELLFDAKADPCESVNFANNKAYSNIKADLKKKLIIEFKARDNFEPFDGDDFRLFTQPILDPNHDLYLLGQDPPSSLPNIKGYERDCEINPVKDVR